ncbi:MAG: spoIIIAE [Bacillales bacterium]|jgi:stage III sporulation protein AE|nr:spoIIIAE [Bacillales bacterium]
MKDQHVKKFVIMSVLLSILFFIPETGYSATISQKSVDTSQIESVWDGVSTEYNEFLPDVQLGNLSDYISGKQVFSPKELGIGLLQFAFNELLVNGKLLGMLISLAVFSSFLQTLQSSFEKSTVSKVANAIVLMVLLLIAVSSFHTSMKYVTDTVSKMSDFLMAIIPILLALLATSGGVISAGFFHPIILFLMNSSVAIIQYFVLPLILFSTIITIISNLSDQFKATGLANMLRSVAIWTLGIYMTIFLTVLSIQGVTTAVADGIGLRTAKFISSNFVPVVGKILTDVADTAVNASVLLKNSIGTVGLVILFLLIAFPAIKIFIIAILYKIASIILQPIGDKVVIKCLNEISKNLLYVFASFMIVAFMFFLTITIVITAGNITLMVR